MKRLTTSRGQNSLVFLFFKSRRFVKQSHLWKKGHEFFASRQKGIFKWPLGQHNSCVKCQQSSNFWHELVKNVKNYPSLPITLYERSISDPKLLCIVRKNFPRRVERECNYLPQELTFLAGGCWLYVFFLSTPHSWTLLIDHGLDRTRKKSNLCS